MKCICLVAACMLSFPFFSLSQETEFPKGWVLYAESKHGMLTTFSASPERYVFTLGLSPEYTVISGHLRVGLSGGALYANNRLAAYAGPKLSWRLKTFSINPLGSIFNLQLQGDHLWGSNRQRLVGGGPVFEIGQIINIGLYAHRDYHLNNWWFQTGVGFNFLHKKKRSATGTDPLSDNDH